MSSSLAHATSHPDKAFDPERLRAQFPILTRRLHNHPLVYLDNAASAQKPLCVIEAMSQAMKHSYANVHRGLHTLASEATEAYEQARAKAARFLGVPDPLHIIFTKGATEAINLVAHSFAKTLQPGDEIVLTEMEHHANIVPWHFLRQQYGAVLKWVPVLEDGSLDWGAFEQLMGPKTKLIAMTHMSNVLGTVNDITRAGRLAQQADIPLLVDGAQAAVHLPRFDLTGVSFYAATGHKLYGPTGLGFLYMASPWLENLPPYQGGGEMIAEVRKDAITYADPPHKFEAGTPPILEAQGLGVALDWLSELDRLAVLEHETALYQHALEGLKQLKGFKILGQAEGKGSILSFTLEGVHPHDLAQILDRYGVAIRAGHHCAQPLMIRYGVAASARASFALYNTLKDVEVFVDAVGRAQKLLLT